MNTETTTARRALRLGVAGPVGTGKSSTIANLCRALAEEFRIGVITNDIYTDEDAQFLRAEGVLPGERIRAVETGACPHTAIRDDVTMNLLAVEDLERDFAPLDIVLVESGGDVARKGGPGIGRADLLVINKVDLAPYVDVDVEQMLADASTAREGRAVIGVSRKQPETVEALAGWVRQMHTAFTAGGHVPQDPGPMAPHFHADEDGEGGYTHSHEEPAASHSH
ncbi:MAG: urease accessory protein UreG [Brachybacterium sp.]|nr:urease accessory protein UreG [Brachybacterium sp.]